MATQNTEWPCPTCKQYKIPSLTVDAGVLREIDGKQHVLMIERAREPFKGSWAFPGGFVDYGEDPPNAALRELKEETNLVGRDAQLVTVSGSPTRDPRSHIVTILYRVQVDDFSTQLAGDDAANARFIPVDSILDGTVSLAFDHRQLLDALLAFRRT